MKAPDKSIRTKGWLAATVIAVAASLVALDSASSSAAADVGEACEIDLGRLLSAVGENDRDGSPSSRIFRLADHRLVGRVEADLQVTGMPTAPRISGDAELVDGTYENLTAGTLIENLTIAVAAAESNVMRLTFTGTDGDSGAISGGGSITVEPDGGLVLDGTADLNNVTLLRRDDIVAAATGSVAYVGTPCRGRLEGRLENTKVDIRLVDLLPPSVVEIEVVEIGAGGGKEPSPSLATREHGRLVDLDLTIDMPGGVIVSGRGIDSEWSGDLVITGNWAKPEIRGVLSLVRGEISFAGRAFVLIAGTIAFEKGQELSPLIDMTASHEGKDITALMHVTGSASAPEVVLTSQPELPQDEILARVMFGKSIARLSPAQVSRVAAALRALSRGETLSEDVFGLARTLLGVDILADERRRMLSSDGNQRPDGDGRSDEQSGPGPVEIEIAPGISIAADQEADESLKEGTLGIIWKWDY
jgi:translocation and assembly module TamB